MYLTMMRVVLDIWWGMSRYGAFPVFLGSKAKRSHNKNIGSSAVNRNRYNGWSSSERSTTLISLYGENSPFK